jgi:hypothetical protein
VRCLSGDSQGARRSESRAAHSRLILAAPDLGTQAQGGVSCVHCPLFASAAAKDDPARNATQSSQISTSSQPPLPLLYITTSYRIAPPSPHVSGFIAACRCTTISRDATLARGARISEAICRIHHHQTVRPHRPTKTTVPHHDTISSSKQTTQ